MSLTRRLRTLLKGVLQSMGLYGLFWRLRGAVEACDPRTRRANRRWLAAHPEAPPLPPPRLIYDVVGVYRVAEYVAGGRAAADKIEQALAEVGRPLDEFTSVLDFGCGCGRIIRHFVDRSHARWHGCDYNRELVQWCRDHLQQGEFRSNELRPPLSYEAASFDLVYANSVFTHLDEELELAWLEELQRILQTGGALLVTTHGDIWREGLDARERARYDRGELVVRAAGSSGSNLCETYHPPRYFRRLTEARFARVHHLPRGRDGRREQDVWVLERA